MGKILLYGLVLLVSPVIVLSFNLDVEAPIVHRGSSGEFFGYNIALHSQANGKKWVVVGAPLGNRTSPSSEHNRYGSVYKCDSDSTKCEVIIVDNSEPRTEEFESAEVDLEEKTGQWLGATVLSSTTQSNAPVVACAPRYKLRGEVRSTPEERRRLMLGKCFFIRNDLSGVSKVVQPCYAGDNGYNTNYKKGYHGYCQAGFSGAMSSDSDILLTGLVGSYYSKGAISAYFGDLRKTAISSNKQMPVFFGDTMGYAVAIGHFRSSNKEELIASSSRADNLQGKVMAFEAVIEDDLPRLVVSFTLPPPKSIQVGSNFGQSLCAVDLNNDGYSDLLVGAPYHSHQKDGDEGIVYVYINRKGTLNHLKALSLFGEKSKHSHFGFAMAVAGDLNRDGYPDVAISAPYGGEQNDGVVYIYFGTKDGIETYFRQKISASDVSPGVKTFGYSLAGNVDVDGNGYQDLAVGAYSSDRAFLFRSRPIIEMEGKIELSTSRISLENNKTMCLADDGTMRKCIYLIVCLKYKNQISQGSPVDITYTVDLDRDRLSEDFRRMFFLEGNNTLFSVSRQVKLDKEDKFHCQFVHTAFLRKREHILDVFEALTFDLTYDLTQASSCTVCPILNDYNDISQRSFRAEADFIKKCADNEVCEPDLAIKGSVTFDGGYNVLRIGNVAEMTVKVEVENKAQDAAYPGVVIVTYPSIIDYAGSQDVPCSVKATKSGEKTASCIVGKPFHGKTKKQLDIRFSTPRVTGNISEFSIRLEAKSPSQDANPADNEVTLTVGVKFVADLTVNGFSNPDQVVYSDKIKETKHVGDVGPQVRQTISVRNRGPSPVEYADVTILLPHNYGSDQEHPYLLYIMDVQVLGNAGSCKVKTNPLGLQFDNNTDPVIQQSRSSVVTANRALRNRRDADQASEEQPCDFDGSMTCLKIPCHLGRMEKGDHVKIQIMSLLWQNTLIKAEVGSIVLETKAEVFPPSSIAQPTDDNNNVVKIKLTANPTETQVKEKKVPIWVIIVSVLGGLLLLILAGYGLYRLGFFKRNRYKLGEGSEEEMTPMKSREPSHRANGKTPVHV